MGSLVKTEVHRQSDGTLRASINGKIDEHFDGREILEAAAGCKAIVLKLDGIRSISSLGVRALENFLHSLDPREIYLEEISAAVANQFSMIPTLLAGTTVRSARLPFICPSCGQERTHAIPYLRSATVEHAPPCGGCGVKMEFDGFTEEYLPV